VAPAQIGPLFPADGGLGVALIVKMPLPVAVCPSGLTTETFCAPKEAAVVLRTRVAWVTGVVAGLPGMMMFVEFTVTPPVTVEEM
jgi:hypothetical protein